jgi:phosphoglycolate/pyridoxal phosphate phosphatase family enzyme
LPEPFPIQEISAVILDMDGVLYRGNRVIDGAPDAVGWLRRIGKKLIFITNNSAKTRAGYARKLMRMGIPARESEIVTAGYAAAVYLRSRWPDAKIYVVGEEGLRSELKLAGLRLVSMGEAGKATHVVVGIDRGINYRKIAGGLLAIMAGAKFIATNMDSTHPTEKGLLPGAGAMVGAIAGCSGRRPDLVIGKPSPFMVKIALGILGARPEEALMIGDRVDTDVRAGRKAGVRTALVLSGVCKEEDLRKVENTDMAPDLVLRSIADVMDWEQ